MKVSSQEEYGLRCLLQVARRMGEDTPGRDRRPLQPLYDPSHCEKFSGTEETCVHVGNCGVRPVWSEVNRFLSSALENVTLADLLESERRATRRLQKSLHDEAIKLADRDPGLRSLPVVS